MTQEVAITLLVFIGAARDDVHRNPTTGVVIQSRQLASRQRRCDKAWAMCQQKVDIFCCSRSIVDRQQRIWTAAAGWHQNAVKARVLVGLSKCTNISGIYGRAASGNDFRYFMGLNHADELGAHVYSL